MDEWVCIGICIVLGICVGFIVYKTFPTPQDAYFVAPCPACGRQFSGREIAGYDGPSISLHRSTVMDSNSCGGVVCASCRDTDEVEEINRRNGFVK